MTTNRIAHSRPMNSVFEHCIYTSPDDKHPAGIRSFRPQPDRMSHRPTATPEIICEHYMTNSMPRIHSVFNQCWSTVCDDGSTLRQHSVKVMCVLIRQKHMFVIILCKINRAMGGGGGTRTVVKAAAWKVRDPPLWHSSIKKLTTSDSVLLRSSATAR